MRIKEDKTLPEIDAVRDNPSRPNTPGPRACVVPNRFPALHIEDSVIRHGVGIFDVAGGTDAHEVIIETPDQRHTGDILQSSARSVS